MVRSEHISGVLCPPKQAGIGLRIQHKRRFDQWNPHFDHRPIQSSAFLQHAYRWFKQIPIHPFDDIQHRTTRTRGDEVWNGKQDTQTTGHKLALAHPCSAKMLHKPHL